jgi:hypothetical protein
MTRMFRKITYVRPSADANEYMRMNKTIQTKRFIDCVSPFFSTLPEIFSHGNTKKGKLHM